jgi:hypothetical protein
MSNIKGIFRLISLLPQKGFGVSLFLLPNIPIFQKQSFNFEYVEAQYKNNRKLIKLNLELPPLIGLAKI